MLVDDSFLIYDPLNFKVGIRLQSRNWELLSEPGSKGTTFDQMPVIFRNQPGCSFQSLTPNDIDFRCHQTWLAGKTPTSMSIEMEKSSKNRDISNVR
jgi:hypothetical protein